MKKESVPSIDKIDKQVRQLSSSMNKENITMTSKMSKKKLMRKSRCRKIDERVDKQKNVKSKTEKKNNTSLQEDFLLEDTKQLEEELEQRLRLLYENPDLTKSKVSTTKKNSLVSLRPFVHTKNRDSNSLVLLSDESDFLDKIVKTLILIFLFLVIAFFLFLAFLCNF